VRPTSILPPNPGEAGKQTLEGIDSDSNGIRDDVQRWIYGDRFKDVRTTDVLSRYASAEQRYLVGSASVSEMVASQIEMFRAWNCLRSILENDSEADSILDTLDAKIKNTPTRERAGKEADANLSGKVLPEVFEGGRSSDCSL
jgi:hypothetical protein